MAKRKKKTAKKTRLKVTKKAMPAKRGKMKRKVPVKKAVKRKTKTMKKVVKKKPKKNVRGRTVEEIIALLKAQFANNSTNMPSAPLPISLLQSLYKPTRKATIMTALSMLAGEGLVTNISDTEFSVTVNSGVPLAPS